MSEVKSLWEKASMWAALGSAIASIIGGVIAFTFEKSVGIDISEPRLTVSQKETPELTKQIEELKNQFAALKSIPTESKIAAQLSEFESKLIILDSEVKVINKAILQSPEKALEIPMLKKDIATLQKQYENSTALLEREMSRAYETVKWVIGTIVLGILGLAASVFLKDEANK